MRPSARGNLKHTESAPEKGTIELRSMLPTVGGTNAEHRSQTNCPRPVSARLAAKPNRPMPASDTYATDDERRACCDLQPSPCGPPIGPYTKSSPLAGLPTGILRCNGVRLQPPFAWRSPCAPETVRRAHNVSEAWSYSDDPSPSRAL